ncbi:MAG: type II toxin-antitoxin system VapC family toxin [Puniceicoccaceae bacterium]
MKAYYDTGVILKLYTTESESAAVRRFVKARKEPLYLNSLHRTECVSAFRLKAFRGECGEEASTNAIADLEDDIASGMIQLVGIDWDAAWSLSRAMADAHAATTGCRTLDTLHVACARSLGIRELISSDKRQRKLARAIGMRVTEPR